MRCDCQHIDYTRKQQWLAWIILSVYVPMVLLSSMHVHAVYEYAQTVDCHLCETAVHHSGHITASTGEHGECLSCRFLNTQVDIPKGVVCFVDNQEVSDVVFSQTAEPIFPKMVQPSLRAPPSIL